ncbi:TPA: hypothetical protein VM112_000714 [Streptococcus pyogenes]|nr:hypothetical protein [Streptococcus pyogenes]HES4526841.1 hypothetical protein [Streptococcus pyogenes]
MNEINNSVQIAGKGEVTRCILQCVLLCGACGITPIPGDEFYGAASGGAAGAAGWA